VPIHQWRVGATITAGIMVLTLGHGAAQVNASLTDQDRSDIQALIANYARALSNCAAEEYADLFATPGGYFGSSTRGEVRERQALMGLVRSETRCQAPAATTQDGGAGGPPPNPRPAASRAAPIVEAAPEGAKGIVPTGGGGGHYDDVYVRTPAGWRFKSRNVISDPEAAAHLTAQDFIEIRQLAGDDHGHYEDVYGEKGKSTPLDLTAGTDHRPFRASGLVLTPSSEGVRGTAYLRNNGGRYDDLYVKTAEGWRIKSREYTKAADH
jgi:peptidoglycan hydrolase-like protein with peptidoglycan-binding domain